jgi:hypothetical protein
MAIEKISGGTEQVFEKEIATTRKERFTLKQKEAQKARLQALIDVIDADIAEAKAVKEAV